jgi:hypothetical protein
MRLERAQHLVNVKIHASLRSPHASQIILSGSLAPQRAGVGPFQQSLDVADQTVGDVLERLAAGRKSMCAERFD